MKRVFSWLLIVVLCLGLFAGCKKDNSGADGQVNTNELKQALEYVKTVYKNASEKTPKDYQRIGNVPVNGVDYEVVWSANVGDDLIKVVKGSDGMVTIDVNEEAEEDTPYELTATVAKGGVSVSHTWKHLLPAGGGSMLSIVEDAYALEVGASLDYEATLKGKIIKIDTPWSDQYGNITVTIVVEGAEDKPIQCYRLTGEGAKDLGIGDTITVTGTLKNYNGTIEFDAGCVLGEVIKGEKVEAPEDPKQIVKEAYELPENGALPYEATLTGVITKIDTNYSDVYGNVTVTMVVEDLKDQPIQCYRLEGKGVDQIGKKDTITVTGWIVNYKGKVQFGAGCKLVEWKNTGSEDPAGKDNFVNTKVTTMVTKPKAGVAYKFYMKQAARNEILYLTGEMDGYYMATTKNPDKAVDVYYEEVSGGCRLYFMKGGVKTYLAMEKSGTHNNAVFKTSPYTLKWNSTINGPTGRLDEDLFFGTYSKYYTFGASPLSYVTGSNAGDLDTKNFVGHLGIVEEKAVEKETAAQKAFAQLKADYFSDADVVVTPEDYQRKSVYEIDKEKAKVTWTVTGSVASVVDNGDGTVTVKVTRGAEDVPYVLTATIQDGDKKLTQSWNCSAPALPPEGPRDIVEAAYQLEANEELPDAVTLTGMVLEVTSPYDPNYGNVTVTIMIEDMIDKPISCYRLAGEGADKLAFGDYITVTGNIINYNGTKIQFKQGCTLDERMTQAQLVDKVYALEVGDTLPDPYVMIANVVSIDDGYSEQYGNITISVAVPGRTEKPIKCFRMTGDAEVLQSIEVGGMVAVFGDLTHYKKNAESESSYQFAAGNVLLDYAEPEIEEEDPKYFVPKAVESPAFGKAYKYFLYQGKLGKNLYFNGALNSQGYYLGTTEDWSEAVNVYLEDAAAATGVTGAIRFYFLNDADEKVYIETFLSGSYVNNRLVKDPTMYYTYDATAKTYVVTLGEKVYYLGTYNTNAVIRASETKYITGENAANVGVTQFVAQFATLAPAAQDTETVTPPVEFGTAYKYFLYQGKLEKALYFNGALNSQGYYLGTTEKLEEAVDVYVEDASADTAVTGAVRFYFLNDADEKVYIETFLSGSYVNNRLVKDPTMYYVYDATAKTYVVALGEKVYYLGTYNTNTVIRASETKYITGENAANVGVTQFVAQFGKVVVKEVAPVAAETPAVGKAYKYFLNQVKLGKPLYFNGALNSQGYYLGTTEDYTEAVDVYIEDAAEATGVAGAVRFYFLDESEEKVYIETFLSGTYVNNRLVKEATMYYTYDATAKTYVVTLGEKVYYLGTYNTNAVIRASETKYITGENAANVGVTQFVAQFGTIEFVEDIATP